MFSDRAPVTNVLPKNKQPIETNIHGHFTSLRGSSITCRENLYDNDTIKGKYSLFPLFHQNYSRIINLQVYRTTLRLHTPHY